MIPPAVSTFLCANAVALNALFFLLGLLGGHYFSLGRDRRREFNEAAFPISKWLLAIKENPFRAVHTLTDDEVDAFCWCLSDRKAEFFRDAIYWISEDIRENRGKYDPVTDLFEDVRNPDIAVKIAIELLPLVRRQ